MGVGKSYQDGWVQQVIVTPCSSLPPGYSVIHTACPVNTSGGTLNCAVDCPWDPHCRNVEIPRGVVLMTAGGRSRPFLKTEFRLYWRQLTATQVDWDRDIAGPAAGTTQILRVIEAPYQPQPKVISTGGKPGVYNTGATGQFVVAQAFEMTTPSWIELDVMVWEDGWLCMTPQRHAGPLHLSVSWGMPPVPWENNAVLPAKLFQLTNFSWVDEFAGPRDSTRSLQGCIPDRKAGRLQWPSTGFVNFPGGGQPTICRPSWGAPIPPVGETIPGSYFSDASRSYGVSGHVDPWTGSCVPQVPFVRATNDSGVCDSFQSIIECVVLLAAADANWTMEPPL